MASSKWRLETQILNRHLPRPIRLCSNMLFLGNHRSTLSLLHKEDTTVSAKPLSVEMDPKQVAIIISMILESIDRNTLRYASNRQISIGMSCDFKGYRDRESMQKTTLTTHSF